MADQRLQEEIDVRRATQNLLDKVNKNKELQEPFSAYLKQGKSPEQAYTAALSDVKAAAASRQEQANQEVSKLTALASARNAASASMPGAKKDFFTNFANSLNNTAGDVNNALGSVDAWAITQIKTFRGQSAALEAGINEVSSSIVTGISGVGVAIEGTINGLKQEMHEALKPVSYAVGSTAMMVENIARNPLGAPQALAQGAVALLSKVSPELAARMEGAGKSINLENLANLPGQMMGSMRSLALAADALLSVPFTIMSDIYNGLMDIMEEIANLIDTVVSAIFDFFFGPNGLLDSILPITEILSMLEAIGELASFVGDVANLAGGFSVVTDITSQITGSVSDLTSAFKNPLQLIPGIDQVTGGISQITGALRNPEQFLPAGISEQMQKISSIPGLGFVSNYGTSIGDTLDGLSQGIFTKVLDNYTKQIPMLAPLMGQQPPGGEQAAYTQENYAPTHEASSVDGRPTFQNGVAATFYTGDRKIFPEDSPGSQTEGPISAYGMTYNPTNGSVQGTTRGGSSFGERTFKSGGQTYKEITAYGGVTEILKLNPSTGKFEPTNDIQSAL